MRLSIKALRYFLAATSHGSIARAADELNVVPSAISNAIDQVEAEFKLKLVQRYPAKGIAPTAAGVTLMRKIRYLIEEYDVLMLEGVELRTSLSGSLSVGYYAPIAPAFMPAIAGPLMRNNPDLRVNFVECDNERAQAGLLAGEFDLIVFVADNVRSGIEYDLLIEAPPYLLVRAQHRLAKRASVSFADMSSEPLVLLDLPFTSEYFRGLLDDNFVEARIVATASTSEMVRSLVGAGVGVSILNMRPNTAVSYAGQKLAAVPINDAVRPLKLVSGHLGGNQRRLVRTFADACRNYFMLPIAQRLVVSM